MEQLGQPKVKIDKKIVGIAAFYKGKEVFRKNLYEEISNTVNTVADIKKDSEEEKEDKPVRGPVVAGYTVKIPYEPAGKVYLTLNFVGDRLVEVFINATRNNPELVVSLDVAGRLVSSLLKHGAEVDEIIKHLKGADAGNPVLVRFPGEKKGKFIKSIFDLVGFALSIYNKEKLEELAGVEMKMEGSKNTEDKKVKVEVSVPSTTVNAGGQKCPECGSDMFNDAGCWTCPSCGYSKCG